MRLQDQLPAGVTVGGRFYKMNFDFRNVLRMIDVLNEDLLPEAKAYNALHCLCKHPRNVFPVLEAVKKLLFKAPMEKNGQNVTDFIQDAGLIRASFWQSYRIDLYREKLHWIAFTELLNAIPEGSRYAEVVSIRARPMPAPTKFNTAEREWLMKAKRSVALEMSEEKRVRKYQQDVANIASVLMAWAGKGSESDV